MTTQPNATGERIAAPESAPDVSALMSVDEVAGMLACSARTIYRLADAGRLPRPVKLGALVRWRRGEILDWVDAGCPNCAGRRGNGGRR